MITITHLRIVDVIEHHHHIGVMLRTIVVLNIWQETLEHHVRTKNEEGLISVHTNNRSNTLPTGILTT